MDIIFFLCSALLLAGLCSAKPVDVSEPNAIPEDIIDLSQDFLTTTPEELSANDDDSCDDYPPAKCLEHFHPLPRSLHRDPFNIRSEDDFNAVCGTYKNALQCVGEWVSKCNADRPNARQFVNMMLQLLERCDDAQVRADAITSLECGRRMGSIHDRCMRETRFIPQLKGLNPERLVMGETNSVRDLCCGIRYHKACYIDQVVDRCGQEAMDANLRMETVVMTGFNCAAYPESECPSIRSSA